MSQQALQQLLSDRPWLIGDCTVTPTVIRHEHWVIVKNPVSGTLVRLHRDLWVVMLELDGDISLHEWIQTHAATLGDQRLLSAVMMLRRMGILCFAQTHAHTQTQGQAESESFITKLFVRRNPLMLRFALFNPTLLVDSICRVSAPLNRTTLSLLWLAVVLSAGISVLMNWSLVAGQWQASSAASWIVYFLLLYPLSKCLHELAHGWALRRLGGQVPEAGISFLVFFPMPYVDATDAWTLPRRHRMLVTGAGMLMDLFVSGLGILLWLNLSSGIASDMALSLAVIGIASVAFFNANPLLKFDGYYLLEDALDSPGLARRSLAYYRYLLKRHVLVLATCVPPVVAQGERLWLLVYGLLSTLYRFFIAAVICVFLVSTLHELGVLLSLFSLLPLIVIPLWQFLRFLAVSAELELHRTRACLIVAALLFTVTVALFAVPVPSSTRTQGVVWVEAQAEIYAMQTGQLDKLLIHNGDRVDAGQVIMVLDSTDLALELAQTQAAVRLAKLEVAQFEQQDPARARSALINLRQAESEVKHALGKVENLSIRSPVAGRVALSSDNVVTGINIEKGTLVAYVVNDAQRIVRAVVDQSALGMMEQGIDDASIRLAQDIGHSFPAVVSRQTPSGSHELPSEALAENGLGGFSVESGGDADELRTLDTVFHLELTVSHEAENMQQAPIGSRAFVTLIHPDEPLGQRWLRVSRQLLIKHLSV